jgi:predicted phage replisome organizer
MGEVQWIKIYIDMFDKRKIKKLRRLPAGNELLLIWVMLLATAGKCNAGGMIYITENVPFTEEDLADELGFEVSTIKLALKAFEELDMIATTDDGFISVIGWEEYQNIEGMDKIREQNRLRKQRQRENQRLLEGMSRDSHGTVTQCHAIEEEKEEDQEKEFHSFIHSAHDNEEYVEKQVRESGLTGADAETYRAEVKERLKMRYMKGSLGQGVVFMSDEQFEDLCDKLTMDELDKYFEIVAECEKSGKRYKKKSHYQAILDMAARDRRIGKG